ncbi:hypothetical protein CCAX7_41060 [Capsulimonas corticalis]|uniref:Uncharacterized protein n=1 Tax=Capsulimonas corticalis TaxID=2219043 RepID=A0A402D6E2_9BACT|nr:hypothetical protein [Capsulimonas corticalis]BDI32055.1 hypothetical protein CCAX7_41060 [Capsulimonas corticalis]
MMKRFFPACAVLFTAAVAPALAAPASPSASRYFAIQVVDAATGRGVPLVELRATSEVRYYTDSNGIAAIDDPEMMEQSVYFSVKSAGYSYPKDGMGYAGVALKVTAGGKAVIKIARDNIAERLYRLTGAGIYRDSLLVGAPVPTKRPLLNGQVTGQDTVEVTPYKGKIYWFFGDTNKPSYPLGQFDTSGATSLAPGAGGLDPSRGVDLTYWVDPSGFSRPMAPPPHNGGPVWVAGLFTLTEHGAQHLYTHFAEVDHSMKMVHSGLAKFNDEKAVFEPIHTFDISNALRPEGHPFLASDAANNYIYFQPPRRGAFPLTRTIADEAHVTDPATYEAFTCLAPGARVSGRDTPMDRDAFGRLIWGWKRNTQPVGLDDVDELVKQGLMKREEALVQLRDISTDATVISHGGSVFWNAYRKRWILITTQMDGSPSSLGELWFAEADTPVGPWTYARKIATHDHYTFYNPTQHPFFDQDGGRLVYFEGTYTDTFSDVKDFTPRYNYNQLMYRLSLDDTRLSLPVPVYQFRQDGVDGYGAREQIDAGKLWSSVERIPFYAAPPSRKPSGLIPLYVTAQGLQTQSPGDGAKPLVYVLPAAPAESEKSSPGVAPLYEFRDDATARRWYSTDAQAPGARRSSEPICRVWRNPSSILALDYAVKPVLEKP